MKHLIFFKILILSFSMSLSLHATQTELDFFNETSQQITVRIFPVSAIFTGNIDNSDFEYSLAARLRLVYVTNQQKTLAFHRNSLLGF